MKQSLKLKVICSNNIQIPIDEEELKIVLAGVSRSGQIVKCKKGIFNSSFFVAVVEDEERRQIIAERNSYRGPSDPFKDEKLQDLFQMVVDKISLSSGQNAKLRRIN